ncbi:hypothetical protein SK128_000515 [Halocaridina rubra]|uniref:Uncharacterized protein n=1 Tax=Halocaridina rubra TaxID=373956 RepID=A0AAN8WCQ9_HALRR
MVAPEHINCYKAKDIGKEIIAESLKYIETFGELKVRHNKRGTPMSSTTASVKVGDDIIHIDSTQLFQRTICTVKAKYLRKLNNKQCLIMHLREALHNDGTDIQTAVDNADVLIVQTAILEANQHESVVVVGQDVTLLTLITALTPEEKMFYC